MKENLNTTIVKLFLSIVFIWWGLSLAFVPLPSQAASSIVPCGKNSGTTAEQAPCTICHVVVAGNNLIKWGLGIMSVIAITVLFAMAVLYVVSAGNQGMMQTAKGGIMAAFIGFGVMLAAWLIVNIVLSILVDNADTTKPLGGLVQNGTFSFSCDQSSNAKSRP